MKTPAHATMLLCALLLAAGPAGCGGGFVYRPTPEPRYEQPADISVEQDIYQATAKSKKPAPAPQAEAAPEQKKPEPPPPAAEPATAKTSAKLYDTICLRPDGTQYAVVAGAGKKEGVFYSLHLHSYKRFDYAMTDATELVQKTGKPVFVRRTELPDSGSWHRIYVGVFPSKAEGEVFGQSLQPASAGAPIIVHELPLAILDSPGA